jgi:hypothetical protein
MVNRSSRFPQVNLRDTKGRSVRQPHALASQRSLPVHVADRKGLLFHELCC